MGDQLTRVLRDRTLFRVVGIDSTSRILAQPDGIQLYQRFRSLINTSRNMAAPIARSMGERMGVGAVLYPRLALSLSGPVSGEMALTVLAYVGLALQGFRTGELAGDDPWDAHTLEWATSSPPPSNNFAELHTVMSAQPLLDLKPSADAPKTETA